MNNISDPRPGDLRPAFGLALLLFVSAAIPPAAAQTTNTWDAGGADTSWGTASNWAGDVVPTFNTNAILVFDTNVGANNTLFLAAQRQIRGMTFGSNLTGTDGILNIRTRTTLNGATVANLLFNGGATNASITLDNNTAGLTLVRLGQGNVGAIAFQTTTDLFHNASGVVLQFDANTTGAGALNKHGVGAVTFTRANSFNGLNLYGGTAVAWSTATALGTNSVTLGATGSSTNVSLFLGSANTYTNAITVSSGSGTRLIGNTDVTNQLGGFGLTNAITGNATLSGGINLAAGKDLTFAITNYGAGTELMTISGAITGTGGIIKTGTGFLQLSGANTYSGDTVLEGGNIQTTASNSFSAASVLKFGATANARRLQLQGFNQTLGGVDSTAATGGTLIVEAAADNTSNAPATLTLNVAAGQSHDFSGIVRNAAGTATNSALTLVKDGAGTQVLSGGANVSYSGTTTVNAGVLEFAGTNTVANNSAITLGGGTVRFSGGGTRSSTIAGSGNLEKTGANTLTLSGSNSYSGVTDIQGGKLLLSTAGRLGSGVVAIASGANLDFATGSGQTNIVANNISGDGEIFQNVASTETRITGDITSTGGLTINNGTLRIGNGGSTGSYSGSATVASGAVLAFARDNAYTHGGTISGAGGVTKVNAGDVTLTASNDYSGPTTLFAGALVAGDANTLGTGEITFRPEGGNSGTIRYTAASAGTDWASRIKGSTGTIRLDTAGDNVNLAGVIDSSNINGLAKSGSGTLTLSGNNAFTGGTTIGAGVLQLNRSGGASLGTTASVTVGSGATLLISQNEQINNSATVTLSGGTIQRATGVSEVFGNLNLTAASTLDFGSGGSGFLQFGTYARDTGSALLTVQNFFQGNSLVFSQNLVAAGYLDASSSGNYNNGYFAFADGFTTSWNGSNTFTITAIPEPSTYLAAAGLLAVLMWPSRRRLLKDAKSVLGLRRPMRDRLG